ncbi:MAG TPA: tRNA pseudouridine(55) synthase TruB [Myxococcales bacterium LLY-WYZ-16_1]|nr:tRNA pseudouridine(55) synthase TruB [Myxococcales bacterium LLY-WYZ-16_1]
MGSPDGFLFLDKPAGITSHGVVNQVRRSLGTRRVGHCGTLDPMATGLLVVAVGPCTRLLQYLDGLDKRYVGRIVLGVSTTTEDGEGEVVDRRGLDVTEDQVRSVLAGMEGPLRQQPPMVSAVKVGGERLYRKARRGESVDRPWRTVQVHHLRPVALEPPELEVDARVSKGTYIRSLAVEVGARLGGPAHLGALRRTEVGPWSVDGAILPEAVTASDVVPAPAALRHWVRRDLTEEALRAVAHGRPLPARGEPREVPLLLVGPGERVAGVAFAPDSDDGGTLRYGCVLVRPDSLSG